MKRIRRIFAILAGMIFLPALLARAQFIGYVAPQTEQQVLAQNVACNGASQFYAIQNLGQTQHYLTVSAISGAVEFQATIQGVDVLGNVFSISDPLMAMGTVKGSGYYPKIQIKVFCVSGTYTATYSGAWGTYDSPTAAYALAQTDKIVFNNNGEGSSSAFQFQTPFSSAAGEVDFQYSVAGAGGSLQVECETAGLQTVTVYNTTLANTTALQTFIIPPFSCQNLILQYTTNSVVGTIFAEYLFTQPGANAPAESYTHVTTTTATAVKGTFGFLHTLTVNTGAAGTISLFDLPAASCTATPSTNTVAVITATATTLQTFTFDVNFLTGICVKASVAMDFTVSSQ